MNIKRQLHDGLNYFTHYSEIYFYTESSLKQFFESGVEIYLNYQRLTLNLEVNSFILSTSKTHPVQKLSFKSIHQFLGRRVTDSQTYFRIHNIGSIDISCVNHQDLKNLNEATFSKLENIRISSVYYQFIGSHCSQVQTVQQMWLPCLARPPGRELDGSSETRQLW